MGVCLNVIKQIFICRPAQIVKCLEFNRHEAAARAASDEGCDSLPVGFRGEPPPGARGVLQLRDDHCPEDSLQRGVVHSVPTQDSERIHSLRARAEDRTYVFSNRQTVCDRHAEYFDGCHAGYYRQRRRRLDSRSPPPVDKYDLCVSD